MTPDTSRLDVTPVPRLALNLEESGKAIGVCGKTVSNLIHDGQIRSVRVGTRHLVPVTELQRFLDREAQSPGQTPMEETPVAKLQRSLGRETESSAQIPAEDTPPAEPHRSFGREVDQSLDRRAGA